MADFQTSTHRAKWIFTPHQLMEKYQASNQRALQTLIQYGSTHLEVNVDGSLSYPERKLDSNKAEKRSHLKPLSIEDERLMRIFYEQKIQEVCGAFGFPRKIQGTAIIYFKRFYLQWSVMEHHPKNIMLTCIYSSCKIEENHVSAEELGKGISQDHQIILTNEMIVLQSLGFDLIVYAPYRSIDGFIDDIEDFCQAENDHLQMLKDFCQAENDHLQMLKDLQETAKLEVDRIILTDAPLLFPPGQLALAALRRSNEVHRVLDFERYLGSVISRQQSMHTSSELIESLNLIDSLLMNLIIPSSDDMKPIDRKLRHCLEDDKKREKKSKHKSKRSSSEKHGLPSAMPS